MATKRRVKVTGVSPDDSLQSENDANVEKVTDSNVGTNVEQSANNIVPAVGGVEGSDMPTYRVDIESSDEVDVDDIQRGPV
jgi:hypothetical protein